MKRFSIILILAASLSVAPTLKAGAQNYAEAETVTSLRHYTTWDNWFIGLHAGAHGSLNENIRPRNFFPDSHGFTGGLSFGKFFSPAVGLRLMATISLPQVSWVEKESAEAYPNAYGDGSYKFKSFNGFADALFNFSNIFSQYKESRRFNVMGLFGFGFNNSFGFDKDKIANFYNVGPEGTNSYPVDTKSRSFFAVRAGFLFAYQLSNALDLTLETTITAADDGFDGVRYDDKYDGYTNYLLGLVYHFKDHYGDRRFKYTTLTDADDIALLNQKINDARNRLNSIKPKKAEGSELMDMTVSFNIDKFNITDVQEPNVEEVANYIKSHPDVNVVICGYADVETAYPAYNMRLSKRRVTAVYNMLTKKFGVDPARLDVDYKGDLVQPYKLKNEWNRVVVFLLTPRK